MESIRDIDLINRYKKDRRLSDLSTLYKRHDVVIFRVCMKILKHSQDSEDASVDIFLELKEKLLKYEINHFPAWLFRLVQNHCYKKLRKKGIPILREINNTDEKVESAQNEDHIEEMLVELPKAIDELSEEQKWCIVLFFIHGKSYKEIEMIKGYSFNQIKSSIQHGKKNLKKKLGAHVR